MTYDILYKHRITARECITEDMILIESAIYVFQSVSLLRLVYVRNVSLFTSWKQSWAYVRAGN